jgi:hypothetical protein
VSSLAKKIVYGFILVTLGLIALPHRASAVSNQSPDPNEYSLGSNIWLEVAHPGIGSSLDAPTSDVIVYFTQPSGTVRLTSASDMCHFNAPYADPNSQSGPDTIEAADTIFSFYKGTNPGSQLIQQFDGYNAGCGTNDQYFSGLNPVQIGDQTLYPVFISATLTGGGQYGTVNAFKYEILGSGYISFYSGSGNQFTIQDRVSQGNPVGDYDMRFGTSCDVTSAQTARLDWFDADFGSAFQQSGGFYFELSGTAPGQSDQPIPLTYQKAQGQTVTSYTIGGADLGGVHEAKSATFTAQPGYKYQWYWHNVNKKNGIQFQMPYNSVFAAVNCSQPPEVHLDAGSCTVDVTGWAKNPAYPNSIVRVKIQVVNSGGTYSTVYDASSPRPDYAPINGHGYDIAARNITGFNPRDSNTITVSGLSYGANENDPANYTNAVEGPRTFGPCVASSCTSSTFPNILGVNEPQTFVVVSTLDAVWGPPYNTGPGGNNPDASTWTPAMYVTVRDPTGAAVYEQATKYTAGNPVATNVLTSFPISFTPTMPGKYYVQWAISGGGIPYKTCGYGAPAPDNAGNNNGDAGYQPYFRVEGGDMAAGAGFGNTGSCSPTTGDITGYGGPTFFGAGSQLGAIARGNITGFSTATNNQPAANPTATPGVQPQPNGLAFSNTGVRGLFNRTSWCVSDYYAGSSADTLGSPDFSATGKHVYQVGSGSGSSTTLNGGTLANGADITVKVNGDVIIANDINYSYGSLDQIPRFRLLVTGNIYIQSNVHNLHGFYDAQPTGSGSGGRVYTCASGPAASTNYTNCNSRLSVYGSITANRIIPGRTKGNYNDNGNSCNGNGNNCNGNNGNGNGNGNGNNCNGNNGNGNGNNCNGNNGNGNGPAESFEYSPELWIFSATSKPTAGSGYSSYDSITNLPPVL